MTVPRAVRVAGVTLRAGMQVQLANKGDLIMSIANGVTYQITVVLFATVIFGQFPALSGWSGGEILLVTSVRLLAHSGHMLLFGNLLWTAELIRQDRVDTWRVRPVSLFTQICTFQAPVNALGDMVVAATALSICLGMLDIVWTPLRILGLVGAIGVGMMIEAALVTHIAALGFRWRGMDALYPWLDNLLTQFAGYPLTIFPKLVAHLFTFGLPLGYIAYYPVSWILGKQSDLPGGAWLAAATPLVALAWLATAIWHWRAGLRALARNP